MMHTVKNISSGMIWANMHLLFWLSLVPFGTGWMGENNFAPNTVSLYAVLLLLCGAAFTILQLTIQHSNQFSPEMENAFGAMKRKGIISVICYTCAIPLAYVNVMISGALFVLVSAIWIVPDKNIERALMNKHHDQ